MEKFKINQIQSTMEINKILIEFNCTFDPPLHKRVADIESYARKLVSNGYVYVALNNDHILGFVAFYSNDNITRIGYLSQIAVKPNCKIKGIGYKLIKQFEKISYDCGMNILKLEVSDNNKHAINFYIRNGYKYFEKASEDTSYMIKEIINLEED